MKRIEAFIRDEKLSSVVDSLKNVGVGGLTITKSQGRGAGERPRHPGLLHPSLPLVGARLKRECERPRQDGDLGHKKGYQNNPE